MKNTTKHEKNAEDIEILLLEDNNTLISRSQIFWKIGFNLLIVTPSIPIYLTSHHCLCRRFPICMFDAVPSRTLWDSATMKNHFLAKLLRYELNQDNELNLQNYLMTKKLLLLSCCIYLCICNAL